MLWILIKGIALGIAIAAPVGPIALLCIRRSLDRGRWIGLATGLGAATADGFYGMVAAFGLTALSDRLTNHTTFLQLFGGLFLCYLGLTTFFSQPNLPTQSLSAESSKDSDLDSFYTSEAANASSILSAYLSTLLFTLTNPATILSFAAIFTGVGITQADTLSSVTLVFGVFTGSVVWWLVLVSGVILVRKRLTPRRLTNFNRLSSKVFGSIIFAFGATALVWAFL